MYASCALHGWLMVACRFACMCCITHILCLSARDLVTVSSALGFVPWHGACSSQPCAVMGVLVPFSTACARVLACCFVLKYTQCCMTQQKTSLVLPDSAAVLLRGRWQDTASAMRQCAAASSTALAHALCPARPARGWWTGVTWAWLTVHAGRSICAPVSGLLMLQGHMALPRLGCSAGDPGPLAHAA